MPEQAPEPESTNDNANHLWEIVGTLQPVDEPVSQTPSRPPSRLTSQIVRPNEQQFFRKIVSQPFQGNVSLAVLERAHPYRVAQLIGAEDLEAFYAARARSFGSTWPAWRELELLNRDDGSMQQQISAAAKHLEPITVEYDPGLRNPDITIPRQDANSSQMRLWFGAALTLAAIPSIVKRIMHEEITQPIAELTYRSVATSVLSRPICNGDRAEALVFALGARMAAVQDDPSCFLHLSSPRESANEYHNARGQVFNHDLFALSPDGHTKMPIEVKQHSRVTKKSRYDEGILRLYAFEAMGCAILGDDFLIRRKNSNAHPQVPEFLQRVSALIERELSEGACLHELDTAGYALMRYIEQKKRHVTVSPKYSAPPA